MISNIFTFSEVKITLPRLFYYALTSDFIESEQYLCAINLNGCKGGNQEMMRSSSPKRYNLAGNRAIFSQNTLEKIDKKTGNV